MKIISVKVLNGPNYWSINRKKLIAVKLDLEDYEYAPTNLLLDFNARLKKLIPTLHSHFCSPGFEGGFYLRLEEGTWLGHVMEHIALELQTLVGMDCGFGRTYSAHEEGVYHVLFTYEIERAGLYAAQAAFNIVDCLAKGHDYRLLEQDLLELHRLFHAEKLGPSTTAIVNEAKKRNIPFSVYNDSFIILGQGVNQRKISSTLSSYTSCIAVDIAANKDITKQMLALNYIAVPKGLTIESIDDLDSAIAALGFPLVIKPQVGNHGRGITTYINCKEKAISGFYLAKKISNNVIIEEHITGDDYRFLVVNYKLVAVARRTPACILGTGCDTIQTLIDEINADPKRGHDHENVLTSIKIDEATLFILAEKKLSLQSILPKGEILYLKGTSNLSSGGTATDVTDDVHPFNIFLAERIARLINLDICGIDIVSNNIKSPLNDRNGAVIEVNASPGFRMHLAPNQGISRNVAAPVIDMLYPTNSKARIPLIAVTGTNGKTTVARLIAHIAKQAKFHVGLTTTDGIYINGQLIHKGDCSGPQSAGVVLREPLVDFAVLECARGGILREGLGFDQCNISIITNISSDHLGLNDIHSLDELTQVKAVVAKSTMIDGYAILNADDDLVYAIKKELSCHIALFGMQESERIKEHCLAGGVAAFIDNNNTIIVCRGNGKHRMACVTDIPLTFNGNADCMVQNLLPAILAAIISNFSFECITHALQQFHPNVDTLPGRMNIFDFETFKVMLDYAHNEGAFIALKNYLGTISCKKKIGIIGAAGDRRPEDIEKLGFYAAEIFDEIIIRHDKDGRGRTEQQLTDLITSGISISEHAPKIKIISNELNAIRYAMECAEPESLIFFSVDNVFDTTEYLKNEEIIFKLSTAMNETQSI